MPRFPQAGNLRDTISFPIVVLCHSPDEVWNVLLHEMMTKAAKYESLSVPTGRLKVSWEVADASPDPTATGFSSTGRKAAAPPCSTILSKEQVRA